MWVSELFFSLVFLLFMDIQDEILFLRKLVAKQNNFSRLWALVCSPP